jgi:hypothetical protein
MNQEFDLEKMLAKSQFALSLIVLLGYFGIIGLGAWLNNGFLKDICKDVATPVSIVIFYWFNRQRSRSGSDVIDSKSPLTPPSGDPK